MRLKQKQFVPFMIVVAIITMGIIVFSSFNFTNKQHQRFKENVNNADSLAVIPMIKIGEKDSVRIADFAGQKSLLVFWASWSDKSIAMLDEIELLQAETDSFSVITALVKDAAESLPNEKKYPRFVYADGASLFNHLKVPGFPSYILFDEESKVIATQIGYKKGTGYDSLKVYLK